MLLISNFIKDDSKFTEKLQKIASIIADINGAPLYLEKYIRDNETIALLAQSIINEIKKVSHEEVLAITKKLDNRVIIHCFHQEDDYNKLILQILIRDIRQLSPHTDNYINANLLESRVFKTLPQLKLDKYNLVHVNDDFQLEQHGIIIKNKHLVYYHPFLRRFFHDNFTDSTLLLKKISKKENIELRIALDHLRLSTPDNLLHIVELDHWWGPKFSKKKLNDPDYVGLTVYKRNKEEFYDWDVDRIEVLVSNNKENGKEVQIEEIVPHTKRNYSSKYFLQKYIHFIWNKEKQFFEHLDTAVKIYDDIQHKKRFDYNWNTKNHEDATVTEKIKIFRLDGEISIELAINLITDFFRYNELLLEFLEGK